MAVIEMAVEVGTSFTSIYLPGSGIVLREPSVIAFLGERDARRVRAVGSQAMEMLGRTPDRTTIVTPVIDGFIADPNACVIMLGTFFSRLLPDYVFLRPKLKILAGIPTGLTVEERRLYEEVFLKAGADEVTLLENIIMSGLGAGMKADALFGGLIVNIGGGTTEMAVMSMGGVITGCGINIGGNMMDKALIDFIAGKYGLKVGINTARKIKHDIGSLHLNDTSAMVVEGADARTKKPFSAKILASDVCEALLTYYMQIADAIENTINVCPPEIASDIYKMGISVAGGASQITGLEHTLSKRLNLPVNIVEDPSFVSILGAGMLLADQYLLAEILSQI